MKDDKFKNFIENKEKVKETIIINNTEKQDLIKENKDILKSFVINKSKLSDSALISLIVFQETDKLNETYIKDLVDFGYISKATNIITESGHKFIDSDDTINRIKSLI